MKNIFSIKQDVYPLLRLAVPLALKGFVQCAPWFFETLFLAQLGEYTLAAGALVSWLFATIAVILLGTLGAINILVSHKHGANDQKSIADIAQEGLLQAVLLAIPTIMVLWNMAPLFLVFGQSESVVVLAQAYLRALSWGILPNFLQMACLEMIIGLGHTRVILIFSIITVSLNIICSYVLIFGKYGFPALGIAGAGWGMTLSYWITLIILTVFIVINKQYRIYYRQLFEFRKPKYLLELFQVGVPIGLMYCVEVGFFFAFTLAMGLLGTTVQAANQVAVQYLGLVASTMFALSQAITVRMGHLLGAGNVSSATSASYVGVTIAVLLASIVALIYWITPNLLISIIFNIHDPVNFKIVNVIKTLLVVSALFQIVESARIALFGSLRALKETKFTMFISIVSFWCIAFPLGYFIAIPLNSGPSGFWWAMVVSAGVSVVLLQWRFRLKISHYYKAIKI